MGQTVDVPQGTALRRPTPYIFSPEQLTTVPVSGERRQNDGHHESEESQGSNQVR